jgi:putative FmdB family regulatory protein
MPVYAYQCSKCSHEFDAHRTVEKCHAIRCEKCRGKCQIVITSPVAVHTFQPYYSPNLKTVVRTKGQKARLMKQKGFEEYSTIDEVSREARRMKKQEDDIEARKKPDEKFIECYNKALAQHPR